MNTISNPTELSALVRIVTMPHFHLNRRSEPSSTRLMVNASGKLLSFSLSDLSDMGEGWKINATLVTIIR